MQFPHEAFHHSLAQSLASSGRTIAGLGQFLSAENDKDPRTNEQMIRRLRKRLSPQVIELISLLDSIGLELTLVPRRAGDVVDGDRQPTPKLSPPPE
jgi:hypothetical protein